MQQEEQDAQQKTDDRERHLAHRDEPMFMHDGVENFTIVEMPSEEEPIEHHFSVALEKLPDESVQENTILLHSF